MSCFCCFAAHELVQAMLLWGRKLVDRVLGYAIQEIQIAGILLFCYVAAIKPLLHFDLQPDHFGAQLFKSRHDGGASRAGGELVNETILYFLDRPVMKTGFKVSVWLKHRDLQMYNIAPVG